ncbi:MAG: radical SAM protein, partial [Candidatus Marinimicrobia bacterium]|nr:radical SAM protein [Candidatus Neomarinimicrobiota bacterium]
MKSIKEKLKASGLKKILSYIDSDYEKNLPKIIKWIEQLDSQGIYANVINNVRNVLNDPNSNWYQLLKYAFEDIDKNTRRMLLENFAINSSILGTPHRRKMMEQEECNIPWAILMDPTSACNINCIGCWAAEYGKQLNLDLETLDRIIREGKELGIYMYIYSGGEPLIRKKDIITLCERHPDCAFLAFTNGTLIDEPFVQEMARVHNFSPAISIEGFEKETDARRGKGTYAKIMQGMDYLKKYKQLFGISVCYTRQNLVSSGSDEFIDAMIEKGAAFCWYFTYMPIGKNAPTDLMATPEQREFMYHQVRRWRKEKPMFIIDFWNDGEYVKGCIAGGKSYLHINANGDVEPCAFIHYANTNIKESSLLDALKTPLFREYAAHQPFNKNHLQPCPLLDNPYALREIVQKSHARSTDLTEPEDVVHLT